jgi:hypothetical protein
MDSFTETFLSAGTCFIQLEGLMTDNTGYRATLIGHLSNPAASMEQAATTAAAACSFAMTRR